MTIASALQHGLSIPERWPGRVIATIGMVFALAYGGSLVLFPKPDGRILLGDAVHHFVYVRSLVFDRDIHFRNDYIRLYRLTGTDPETSWVYESTPTGRVRNLMPIGPALVWAPAFLATTAAIWAADLFGYGYPLDGFGRAFQASAGLSGVIAATLGCWLAYRAALVLFPPRAAIWAVLVLWLSSSTLYYSLVSPAYSHAASMLAVSAAWLLWMKTLEQQSAKRYFLVGVLCGLAALVRWQDAVILLVPFLDACWHRREGVRHFLTRTAAAGAGAFLAFTPQMWTWMALYGKPLAIPQGAGFMRWTDPALGLVLFSSNHGLLSWTPIIALALAGLVLVLRRAPLVAVAALTFVIVSWYVNASVADWWAGEAFGSRRFVSCFPVFVLGLAALFHTAAARLPVLGLVAAAFIGHTLLLFVQYQAYMHGLRTVVSYPASDLLFGRFYAAADLLAWWWAR